MPDKLPEAMTAIAIDGAGGPEVLKPEQRPVPACGDGQVLIRVAYAGVNRPDILQREGRYPPPAGASDIPGLEIAGSIVAAGRGVDATAVGRSVCALVSGGGYAQYCLAEAGHCLPVADGVPLEQAAALPETLFTVWHNVFQRGWARDGETLLVHGGTSGIGTMAIKLAGLFGLTVLVTCGSDEKCRAARSLGADRAINYRTQDFVEEIRDATAGRGADLVLDMVAGDYTQRNLDCLAEDGRLVTIAVQGGAMAEVNMARLMVRRQTMTGSTLRSRDTVFKKLLTEDIARNVWPAVGAGELRPEIAHIFPLVQAGEAHRRMEAGDLIGKIVLQVVHG